MNNMPSMSEIPSSSFKSPLNKKRRFIPNSIPIIQDSSTSSDPVTTFNSPLLVHVYGQQPATSDVQTQLFQVGMRVRKSVNEGYQVKPKQQIPTAFIGTSMAGSIGLPSFADGFFGMQTPERSWSYSTTNKRTFVQETEEDSDGPDFSPMTPKMPHSDHRVQIPPDYFNINYDFDSMEEDNDSFLIPEDSPSRKGVLRTRVNGRMIAIPKSQKQKQRQAILGRNLLEDFNNATSAERCSNRHQSSGTQWLGHERKTPDRSPVSNDFEDADFLQNREDVEMDCS